MQRILIAIAVAFATVSADSCKAVQCPKLNGTTQISCDMCHKCLDHAARLCFTSDHKNCQCATAIPSECGDNGAQNYTFCYLLDDIRLPPPEIHEQNEHFVSVVVPRFFQDPPFNALNISFLYLLATMQKNETECVSDGHIEAFPRKHGQCLLRIRVLMPKIDYSGHDNYYYDDKSALESQFSRGIFGDSENITLWTEVTIRKEEHFGNSSNAFTSIIKSNRIGLHF